MDNVLKLRAGITIYCDGGADTARKVALTRSAAPDMARRDRSSCRFSELAVAPRSLSAGEPPWTAPLSQRPSEPSAEGARSLSDWARCGVLTRELCEEARTLPTLGLLVAISERSFGAKGVSCRHGSAPGSARAGNAAATDACAGVLRCGIACRGAALTVCDADPACRRGAVAKGY